MTRLEAIDLLDNLVGMVEDNHGNDYDGALKLAIRSLKAWDGAWNEFLSKDLWEIGEIVEVLGKHLDEIEDKAWRVLPDMGVDE